MNFVERRNYSFNNYKKSNKFVKFDNISTKSTYKNNKHFSFSYYNLPIKEKSCGCIIINNRKVLLIQQKKGNWGFPKGHVEFNETEKQTAIREVKEETNLDVRIFRNRRYTEKYISYKGRLKQVVYFLAKQTGRNRKETR